VNRETQYAKSAAAKPYKTSTSHCMKQMVSDFRSGDTVKTYKISKTMKLIGCNCEDDGDDCGYDSTKYAIKKKVTKPETGRIGQSIR
jgi:hypothetical protein